MSTLPQVPTLRMPRKDQVKENVWPRANPSLRVGKNNPMILEKIDDVMICHMW